MQSPELRSPSPRANPAPCSGGVREWGEDVIKRMASVPRVAVAAARIDRSNGWPYRRDASGRFGVIIGSSSPSRSWVWWDRALKPGDLPITFMFDERNATVDGSAMATMEARS